MSQPIRNLADGVRFATLSDGTFVAPLNSFKRHQDRLHKAQQAMSRKVEFSSNWKVDNLRKGTRNTVGYTEINAFGDTSSGCALGQGTHRNDSGVAQCRP